MNRTSKNNTFRIFAAAALAFALSACGGGGGGDSSSGGSTPAPSSATVSGVAAIGAPIVGGSVSLKCASGATASAVTGADGTWQASIKNGDAPCVIRVSGGQADGKPLDAPLHSMIVQPGQANITPLTDLMVGIVTNQQPNAWFDAATNGTLAGAISGNAIAVAHDKLVATLATLPGKPSLPAGFDPLTSQFNAQKGDAGDDLLEVYGAALTSTGLTQSDAVANAVTNVPQTQEAFAGTAFTTPGMTSFRAGAAKINSGDFVLSMPDPLRGLLTSKANLDDKGNVTQVSGPFKAVASMMGNRIAQYCTEGVGAFGDPHRSQYAYISEDWTPVTNTAELHGLVFNDFEDCRQTGTVEFLSDDSVVFTENGGVPDAPDFGFSKALTSEGMVNVEDNTVTFAKVYKITLEGKTTYAYIGVTSLKGSDKPVIDGKTNFVTMGISR